MAPKARAMKRPASAAATIATRAPLKKRHEAAPDPTTSKCSAVAAALAGANELPEAVRAMLARFVEPSLGIPAGARHPLQEKAVAMIGQALGQIESSLQLALDRAQASVNGADAEGSALHTALANAESRVVVLADAVAQRREAAGAATAARERTAEALAVAEAAQRTRDAELRAVAARRAQLDKAVREVYGPLKEVPAEGPDGQKRLRSLQKIGREFGFHQALMRSVPAVLKMELSRRRTFGGAVMTHLEGEFQKRLGETEATLEGGQVSQEERAAAAEAALAACIAADNEQEACVTALSKAEVALAAGKFDLEVVKMQLREFPQDVQQAEGDRERARVALGAFRAGPLAAFQDLTGPTALPQPLRELAHEDDLAETLVC